MNTPEENAVIARINRALMREPHTQHYKVSTTRNESELRDFGRFQLVDTYTNTLKDADNDILWLEKRIQRDLLLHGDAQYRADGSVEFTLEITVYPAEGLCTTTLFCEHEGPTSGEPAGEHVSTIFANFSREGVNLEACFVESKPKADNPNVTINSYAFRSTREAMERLGFYKQGKRAWVAQGRSTGAAQVTPVLLTFSSRRHTYGIQHSGAA